MQAYHAAAGCSVVFKDGIPWERNVKCIKIRRRVAALGLGWLVGPDANPSALGGKQMFGWMKRERPGT